MHFKVTARTILQLGAELISSDAIAFYELIKNAFDAGSKKVEVRIVIRINPGVVKNAFEELNSSEFKESKTKILVGHLMESIDTEAPHANELLQMLESTQTKVDLEILLKKANFIMIRDTGEGMSLPELDRIYLTIGTRNRHEQRSGQSSQNVRPILGEKGLGRLSVMRLGDGLTVETTKTDETHFNVLEIDWSVFSHESNGLLDEVEIEPRFGTVKTNVKAQGTTILIYDLKSNWTKERLEEIGRDELSRFIDPFQRTHRDFIVLWFNKEPIPLTGIDTTLFENAQAYAEAKLLFGKDTSPIFSGTIDYKMFNRRKSFHIEGTHLLNITKDTETVLRSLGPFSLQLYYYNRKRISAEYGVMDWRLVKKLVERWGGGVMVYRDGFRVNPYGGPDDDWLNLDKKALAAQGYKLNRRQFVGKLEISTQHNPKLLDQTNRQGLRDSPEKAVLISLLQHLIWVQLKSFLESVDQAELEKEADLSLKDIEKRIEASEKKAKEGLFYLLKSYPELKEEGEVIDSISKVLDESKELIRSVKISSESLEKKLSTTIHLAGLGLMVDVIAHELNRAIHQAIQTLNKMSSTGLSQQTAGYISTLRTQLKTLQARLKVLDPLGPSGRQRKEMTNISQLVEEIVNYHSAQFERHRIKIEIQNDSTGSNWEMNLVPGMIVQILENLITNSVYWLKQEVFFRQLKNPKIGIILDRKENLILITDNGPGVPSEIAEDIFQPFFTTKPPTEGKGLGLYIAREIAAYHGAQLYLMKENTPTLRTFVLDLSKSK